MQITYRIELEPECCTSPEEGLVECADAADLQEIHHRLECGDYWAWGMVAVIATVEMSGEKFEGYASLGCCSYEDEEEFKQDDGYYPQMKKDALDDLKKKLQHTMRCGEIARTILGCNEVQF